jgi:hypothetical protein
MSCSAARQSLTVGAVGTVVSSMLMAGASRRPPTFLNDRDGGPTAPRRYPAAEDNAPYVPAQSDGRTVLTLHSEPEKA